MEGVYCIKGMAPGDYTLRVSYIRYRSKQMMSLFRIDGTYQLNFDLFPDIIQGEGCSNYRTSIRTSRAINQQLTSNTIVNVVSEEKIQELPDANAAEAIGRLPGVSVTRSGGEATKIVLRGLSDKYTL